MRSLAFRETALGLRSGSVASNARNLGTSLFPPNVGVKENRKILLCKMSGGEREGQRSPPYVGLCCLILPTSATHGSGRAAPIRRGEWARVGSSSARSSPPERPKVDAFREGGA